MELWRPELWLPRNVEWHQLPTKFEDVIYPVYLAIPLVAFSTTTTSINNLKNSFRQTICQILDDTFVYIAPGFANDTLKVLGGLGLTVIGINPTDENSPKILDRI
uniref:Transposase n=1 Tax=Heterorhabditis bacteriophora TaxID=37862 RepID=A0A1I7W7R9_HETBA